MITVFDQYGRQMQITRQQWRENILGGTIQKAWNDPDRLYSLIVSALTDGFRSDVVAAAKHLYEIDSGSVRSACIWGIVLMDEGRLDEAENVLRGYLNTHGDNGVILTNLAKVYSNRKDEAKAEQLLWHALEVDPNQDNALLWYQAIHRDRGGPQASAHAMEKIASLPGSWRAPLWLARAALDSGQLSEAMASYARSLSLVGKPIPTDLLMQTSGDLGNHGHLKELISITEPHYDAKVHGITVGNNLIKAHLDLGHFDIASKLVENLYAQNRMDWKQTLNYWDTEISKARVAATHVETAGLRMRMLSIVGPVWLSSSSIAGRLFPEKASDELAVCFLGSSIQSGNAPATVQVQLADTAGRLSRALPLFLAEHTYFGTRARTYSLIPWVAEGGSGFVVSGRPWSDQEAASAVKAASVTADFVVVMHLLAMAEPWRVEIRVIRVKDTARLSTFDAAISPQKPEDNLPQLAGRVQSELQAHAALTPESVSDFYSTPQGNMLGDYLLRLEQLLSVRCAGMDGVPQRFLHGEREIIDGMLHLCLWQPSGIPTRILLMQAVLSMKKVRPEIPGEYREKLQALQKAHPLPEGIDRAMQEMISQSLKP